MNRLALEAPIGSDGVVVLPYGNGAERTLSNRDPGAAVVGLSFNRHTRAHLFRAAQEGIVFALNYGLDIMRGMNVDVSAVRAGRANMFLSPLFARAFADTSGAVVELFETDGAQGAARAAGVGAGIFPSPGDAFKGLRAASRYEPDTATSPRYREAYARWREALQTAVVGAEAVGRSQFPVAGCQRSRVTDWPLATDNCLLPTVAVYSSASSRRSPVRARIPVASWTTSSVPR